MKKLEDLKRWLANGKWRYWAAAAGVLLAAAVVILSTGFSDLAGDSGNAPGEAGEGSGELPAGSGGTTGKWPDIAGRAEENFDVPEPLPVSEEEEGLLSGLYGAMDQGDYAAAAAILNENEDAWRTLVQETLGGKRYCYYEENADSAGSVPGGGKESGSGWPVLETGSSPAADSYTEIHRMTELSGEGNARGLVVTRFNTAFFGSFRDGRPEGTCAAIQAMVLDEPRYTYAVGNWSRGKMNGEGKTGYHCYESEPDTAFARTEKSGTYVENLLDGPFQYATENGAGECLHWDMEAEMGVTVLTGAWTCYENRNEYMLPSNEDGTRAYVLKKEQERAVLWNNLLIWDE